MNGSPTGSPDEAEQPQEGTEQTWHRVEKSVPTSQSPTAPVGTGVTPESDLAPPAAGAVPPIPTWAKAVGIAGLVLLLLLAVWIGFSLGSKVAPDEPELPSWELAPPQTLGDLVRGEVTETTVPGEDTDLEVVRADYTDGTNRLVLILSRPQTDLPQLLSDAVVEDVTQVEQASCGVSTDTGTPVCAQITDQTGLMLVGVTEQTPEDLAALLVEFQEVLVP